MRSRREMERASEPRRFPVPTNLGITGEPYSLEAEALFARMTLSPPAARKRAIDNVIVTLKAAGLWTKLDVLQVYAAHDAQAASLNWVASQYNATVTAAPTFTADRGYAVDGVSQYVDSNFNPATASSPKYVQDSAYFGIWSRRAAAVTTSIGGFFATGSGTTIVTWLSTGESQGRINQGTALNTSGAGLSDGTGLWSISRSASNAIRLARNGTDLLTGSTASSTVKSGNLTLGVYGTGTFQACDFAALVVGSVITQPEEATLYSALQAYMTAVGA